LLLRILISHERLEEACWLVVDIISCMLQEHPSSLQYRNTMPILPLQTINILLERCINEMSAHNSAKIAVENAIQGYANVCVNDTSLLKRNM